MLRRFSSVTMICVYYFDSFSAVYGTTYGVMTASKTVWFAVALLLGDVNRFIFNRNSKEDITNRRRAEKSWYATS